jgi:hypothetical protein
MRLVPPAIVISTLSLICAYIPASGLEDNPTALAALEVREDQAQPKTDVFSMPSSSAG